MKNYLEPYIIGETAYNHEGDIKYLFKMIDDIAELGLNAIKFHLLLNPESYMQKRHPLIGETRKWIFTEDEWTNLINYSFNKGLDVVALCDDIESIEFILKNKLNVFGIELHAVCLNDYFMLEKLLDYNGLIILGIGGSTIDEIEYAVDFLKDNGKKDILLMYGFQSYPTNYEDINLKRMIKIREMFDLEVGYADHTAYNNENTALLSVMGYALGARILEKHYTPDFGVERIDFHTAVGKEQMIKIKNHLDLFKKVLGDGSLAVSEPEKKYGRVGSMKKAIVARKNIKKGKKVELDDLWYKRTSEETYLKQKQILDIVGLESLMDIKEDEAIDFSKLKYIAHEEKDVKKFTNIKK